MKGYRTIAANVASLVVMVAAAVLLYAERLPITDSQAAVLGMSATIISGLANIYLRSITTTAVGRSE